MTSARKSLLKQALLLALACSYVTAEFLFPSGLVPSPDPVRVEALKRGFSADTIQLFLQAAFAPQRGRRSRNIHKWSDDLRIKVVGSPSSLDRRVLEQAVQQLGPRLGSIGIDFQDENANVVVYFLPADRLVQQEINYESGTPGVYWCWWKRTGRMSRALMGFAMDITSQRQRTLLMQKYLLRILGLRGSVYDDCDSMLAENAEPRTEGYGDLDFDLVGLLYRPEIYPGMAQKRARVAFGGF